MTKLATFGAGCFWGVEETFRQIPGVLDAAVGYSGGSTPSPNYRDVCTGKTGHAEVVQVEYDPDRVAYARLLEVFFATHDPTTPNRQGPDVGTQYRSAIFTHDDDQHIEAVAVRDRLQTEGAFRRAIVTQIAPASAFHRAEEYHQRYLQKNGGHGCSI